MIELSNTPWINPSRDNQRDHAVLHAVKAAGKLAAIVEEDGHALEPTDPHCVLQARYAADLVISAIRLADICGFDLEMSVRLRQEQKNGMLPSAPGSH